MDATATTADIALANAEALERIAEREIASGRDGSLDEAKALIEMANVERKRHMDICAAAEKAIDLMADQNMTLDCALLIASVAYGTTRADVLDLLEREDAALNR